jgi:hypothetical protein
VWYSAGLVSINSKSDSLTSLAKFDSVKSGVTGNSVSSFSPFSNCTKTLFNPTITDITDIAEPTLAIKFQPINASGY